MANEDFIFRLGADITQFTKSISEVEAELKTVKSELKNLTGQALVQANAYIQQLQGSLTNLNKVGFTGVAKGAQQGQTALFALGQVARDLPFGFIAIQNNLPLLVDQFVALKQSTGGATKALGAILNSIAGPAGLAFAFGVVTSAITGLVQEYGSLSNALGQIFGLTTRTKIATEEFAKSQIKAQASGYAEAASIDNLLKILNNSNSTYQERLGAYQGLKNIIPDVIDSLDKEKTVNGQNFEELKKLAAIKKENIVLDGVRKALIAAIEKETTNAFTNLARLQKQDFFGDFPNALKGIIKGYAPFLAIQLETIDQIGQSADAYTYLSGILDGLDTKIAKNTGVLTQNTDAYNKQQQAIKDAAKEKDRLNKLAQKENLNNLKAIIDVLKSKDRERKALRQQTLEENTIIGLRERANAAYDKYLAKKKEEAAVNKKLFGFRADFTESIKNVSAPSIDKVIFDKEKLDAISAEYNKLVQQRFENIQSIIETTLTQPLINLFDTVLEGGKVSFKDFADQAIKQLKRILIQIGINAAASALVNSLVPGGTVIPSLFEKAKDIVIGGGGVNVGRPSAVNFGGINAGGFAMNGAVSLSLRGSDLVGALNRTNTNINRIG